MFMLGSSTEEMVQMAIDDYFFNLRQFCVNKLPPGDVESARQTGSFFMRSMMQAVYHELDTNQRNHILYQIQLRFMTLLQDYDRKWIWSLFNEFSEYLPDTMVN